MEKLKDKELKVLKTIVAFSETHRMMPTMRELANIMNYSSTSVSFRRVNNLVLKGYLDKRNGKIRFTKEYETSSKRGG